ncbi:MAG: diguanylate cyclase, partial [Candidatus Brocadiales bacterium]
PLCLLMIDMDNFKLINDTHGHPFGDFVLKELANVINKSIRDTDISSRYGGEEFAIILPNTGLDGAYAAAEKLRQIAAAHVFKDGDLITRLTLTIGISSLAEEDIKTKADMIKHADEAMYEGKIRGKNMVISWGEFILWERLVSKEEKEPTERYKKRFMSTARSVKRSYMETAMALIKTLEAKDGYTATHSYLVATYAVRLAEELGLSQENVEMIKNSAILHDIGKIAIPDAILTKTGNLTEEEYNIVKTHPEQSVKILEGIGFLQKELPIILHHQEQFNGKGYPKGLKGTAIPLGARIIAICDAFEATTSKRPYRKSLTYKAALDNIRKGAGERFDPHLVKPFISAIEKFMATTRRIYIPQLNKIVDIT